MALDLSTTTRRTASGLVTGAMIGAAAFGLSPFTSASAVAQQIAPVKLETTTPVKKMPPQDCAVVAKLLNYQLKNYMADLSVEWATDFNNYVRGSCAGVANGKPYEIRVITLQDGISATKIREIAAGGPVSIQATGVKFTTPKGWPPAELATRPGPQRRSDVPSTTLQQ